MKSAIFPLEEILEFLPKSPHKAGEGLGVGEYPFFTSSNEQTKWFNKADYTVPAIILNTGGNVGIQYAQNFSTSTDVFILTSKKKDVSTKYVYYFLNGHKEILERGFKGAGLKHLSRRYTEKLTISLPVSDDGHPNIKEQNRVEKLLDEIEVLKRKRIVADEKMKSLIPELFFRTFGDPRLNSMEWETAKIGELAKVETGSTPRREVTKYYKNGDIPWIRTGELKDAYITSSQEFITKLAIEETNCKIFPENTILLAMYGQGQTMGRVGFMKIKGATNQACAAILPQEKANPLFLYYQLMFRYDEMRSLGRGGNQPNLNLRLVKDFIMLLPPLEIQNAFVKTVNEIEAQVQKQAVSAKKIDELF